ncbi:LANO_0H09406g1_1 [Lachancea nothofagi CBS 11611]|uniref:ATP-dependent (S)-NAD(P)H-hydrate dehydratase n=1 Tax=Lachancea nothofagi CBS 11611 TaxID=1266666 RepID=A0A1G4KMB1_9SACH|nr:LANO_0H09406g1_1 [Lachancea nothofagi CBS 11611]
MLSRLSHKEILQLAKRAVIPPLKPEFHKGQCGRVCVIGGCEDYTGAPYFSAHSAALFGADLTHLMCELNAAPVIKSYTPNLMVHPYLREAGSGNAPMSKIHSLLDRMHVCVVGPGLGRDKNMLDSVVSILEYLATEHKGEIPVVLDADGLFLISDESYSGKVCDILRAFKPGRIILTPNVVEFKRILDRFGFESGAEIARELQCVVLQKGSEDQIWYDDTVLKCSIQGSNKRVGGQGDTLTGVIATMLAFSRATHDFKIWDPNQKLEWLDMVVTSCYVGSAITRECSRLAFQKHGRSMQTTDVNDRVGDAYDLLLGGEN